METTNLISELPGLNDRSCMVILSCYPDCWSRMAIPMLVKVMIILNGYPNAGQHNAYPEFTGQQQLASMPVNVMLIFIVILNGGQKWLSLV